MNPEIRDEAAQMAQRYGLTEADWYSLLSSVDKYRGGPLD